MARIRSIKPEFFTSETLARVSKAARLTFIGLWTYADDNGVALDNERLIAAALYPLEADFVDTMREVTEDLKHLESVGVIKRYEIQGRRYLFVINWDEHQKVSHPKKPRFPRPDIDGTPPPTSKNDIYQETLPEPSGEPPEEFRSNSGDAPEMLRPEQGAGSREQGMVKPFSSPTASRSDDQEITKPPRLDVEQICSRLVELMVANGNKPPKITKQWRDEARRLFDIDKRDLQKALEVLDWCQRDTFWNANIHSIPKFRQQFDKLRARCDQQSIPEQRNGHQPFRNFSQDAYNQGWA